MRILFNVAMHHAMSERADAVGAVLRIHSVIGDGTEIIVEWQSEGKQQALIQN